MMKLEDLFVGVLAGYQARSNIRLLTVSTPLFLEGYLPVRSREIDVFNL